MNADRSILVRMASLVSLAFVRLRTRSAGGKLKLSVGASLVRTPMIRSKGANNTVVIGQHCRLRSLSITIRGDGNVVTIGDRVRVTKELTIWVDENSRVEIGSGCTIESAHLAATEHSQIRLGSDVMISTEVEIRSGDSHSIITAESGERINPAQSVRVDDHVWLGARSTILKGVHLQSNTVVGASSVVANSPHSGNVVVVGNPAHTVRANITWTRDRN